MSLKIFNVSKRFENKWVLRDVSFDAARGEIFGLIGRNGSGKTTLLRIISGAEQPGSGQILFDSRELTSISEKERKFSFPQKESPNTWSSVFKNNAVSRQSKGEYQNSIIQQTMETAQNVVLLDNPFCNLNENLRDESLNYLREKTNEKNVAVVLVTNDY